MKLEIDYAPPKAYYAEFLNVSYQYKRIRKNHYRHIPNSGFLFLLSAILSAVAAVLFYIAYRVYDIGYALGFLIVAFVFFLFYFAMFISNTNRINSFFSANSKSTVELDGEAITLDKKPSQYVKLFWKNTDCVLFLKHSIVFLPKDNSLLVAVPIKYKNEIKKALEELNLGKLIVWRTK